MVPLRLCWPSFSWWGWWINVQSIRRPEHALTGMWVILAVSLVDHWISQRWLLIKPQVMLKLIECSSDFICWMFSFVYRVAHQAWELLPFNCFIQTHHTINRAAFVCLSVCSLSPPRSFDRSSPNLVGVCRWTSELPLRGSFSKRSMGRRVNGSLSLSTILYICQPHSTQLQKATLLLLDLIRLKGTFCSMGNIS